MDKKEAQKKVNVEGRVFLHQQYLNTKDTIFRVGCIHLAHFLLRPNQIDRKRIDSIITRKVTIGFQISC